MAMTVKMNEFFKVINLLVRCEDFPLGGQGLGLADHGEVLVGIEWSGADDGQQIFR